MGLQESYDHIKTLFNDMLDLNKGGIPIDSIKDMLLNTEKTEE